MAGGPPGVCEGGLVTVHSGQYADDRNLRARQRLWQCQVPFFDAAAWVAGLAGLAPGMRVLDAGCGNGMYLRALRHRGVRAVGCDLSPGMLRSAAHAALGGVAGPGLALGGVAGPGLALGGVAGPEPALGGVAGQGPALLNADVTALPARDGAFGAVLAAHLLDLVADRGAAVRELRRVLAPGGACVVVTNGARHLRSLRELIERAAQPGTPGWRIRPTGAGAFTAENAAAQLGAGFAKVTRVQPVGARQVVIEDASVAADYVASLAGYYQPEVARPWAEIAEEVGARVQAVIDTAGAFRTAGDVVAFVCG